MKANLYRYFVLLFMTGFLMTLADRSMAAIETHENYKKGAIHNGDSIIIKDEKFVSGARWSTFHNLSVTDVISFRMLDSVYMPFVFTTDVKLRLRYFTDPTHTVPDGDITIRLRVSYAP